VARVKKSGQVRVLGGVKSDILTSVEADEQVEILESLEKWVKVRTASGYIGYMQKKLLDETRSEARISSFQAPVYSSIALDEPVSMVWHQVTSKAANDQMENLMANTKGVNVIAPTWFMLTDNEGNFDCLCDSSYVSKAHNMGLQVWAVLDNFNRGDEVKSEVLFASTKARRKLIAALMEEVLQNNIDGINIDIEGIKPSAGKHYIQFIRELSVSCRKNGIILSVDSYVPSAYTAFYNRAEQGRVADYVVIMGYDEHYAGGEAGSVASLGYERQGIEDTLVDVPAQKIISAIPLYTRVWKVDSSGTSSTAMGLSGAQKWVADNGVELYWQEDLGQYYGEKQMDGSTYYIWMEDERSLQLKMNLIHQYQLAGVACWKLGFDTADIWDTIQP
jgi:spore germination protein YaaH